MVEDDVLKTQYGVLSIIFIVAAVGSFKRIVVYLSLLTV